MADMMSIIKMQEDMIRYRTFRNFLSSKKSSRKQGMRQALKRKRK